MRVLIIEDELLAQQNLRNILQRNFSDIEIVDAIDSVELAIDWFSDKENQVDIVFMDVELSDGMCFEIFDAVDIDAKVVITTAFDSYAIKAFKVNSIDYILKPIDKAEIIKAVNRCQVEMARSQEFVEMITTKRESALEVSYKKRFSVKIGDRIVIIHMSDVAYFYTEAKMTYVMLKSGKTYIIDDSLESLESLLPPTDYFRVSRSVITSIEAILSVSKYSNSRIKITLSPAAPIDIFVSRSRLGDFLKWINS